MEQAVLQPPPRLDTDRMPAKIGSIICSPTLIAVNFFQQSSPTFNLLPLFHFNQIHQPERSLMATPTKNLKNEITVLKNLKTFLCFVLILNLKRN